METRHSSDLLLDAQQLLSFNGTDGRPLYVALNGIVFDLSQDPSLFAPGERLNGWAGRDATTYMLNHHLEGQHIEVSNGQLGLEDDVEDRADDRRAALAHIEESYRDKYPIVGRYADTTGSQSSSSTTVEANLNGTSIDSPSVDPLGLFNQIRDDQTRYRRFVKSLAKADPQLCSVSQFLQVGQNTKSMSTDSDEWTLLSLAPSPESKMKSSFEKQATGPASVGLYEAITAPGYIRKVLVCEDISPDDAEFLGSLFGLDPTFFQYHVDRYTTFESQDTSCQVFDYPETYFCDKLPRRKKECELFKVSDAARPCNLIRIWKDVYGLFQRIVWTVVFSKEAECFIHIFLLDSLRRSTDDSVVHLNGNLQTFQHYKSKALGSTLIHLSCQEQLLKSLQSLKFDDQSSAGLESVDVEIEKAQAIQDSISDLLCSKWRTMIKRTQQGISESKAPLTGQLEKIEEVLMRKNDFEKMKRTLSVLISSIKSWSSFSDTPQGLHLLETYEKSLDDWAGQLEKVSQSMLGMLAIAESIRATHQSVRSKNLQLLAYVFIPISTVSSIYGMNTTEILNHQPRNWYFVVGAVVAVGGSALLAALYHSISPPAFMAPILQDRGDFAVDVFLLLVSFAAKALFMLASLVLLILAAAAWVALWVPAAVLLVMTSFVVLLKKYLPWHPHIWSISSDTAEWLFVFLGGPLSLWLLVSLESDTKYLMLRAWEFLYFYDIRHPLILQDKSKSRRRFRWTRRRDDPMRSTNEKRSKDDTPDCIVM